MLVLTVAAAALMTCEQALAEYDALTPLYIAAVVAEQDRVVTESIEALGYDVPDDPTAIYDSLIALYARIEACAPPMDPSRGR